MAYFDGVHSAGVCYRMRAWDFSLSYGRYPYGVFVYFSVVSLECPSGVPAVLSGYVFRQCYGCAARSVQFVYMVGFGYRKFVLWIRLYKACQVAVELEKDIYPEGKI